MGDNTLTQMTLMDCTQKQLLMVGGVGISTVIGLGILLPVLFACTLPESDDVLNTIQLQCTFTALKAAPRYCCEHHWSQCDGCSAMGVMNGNCNALKAYHDSNPFDLAMGNNSRQECCDGTCCAETRTYCETCESQSCSTDSKGRQSCSTSYYECNCETECVRHSTRKGTINCGTCHDYEAGFSFELHGQVHNQTRHLTCGLDTATGLDHHHCHRETLAKQASGEVQACWVHKDTLEVHWEEPEWNAGCWAGVAIGGLFLLPCVVAIIAAVCLLIHWVVTTCWKDVPYPTFSCNSAERKGVVTEAAPNFEIL